VFEDGVEAMSSKVILMMPMMPKNQESSKFQRFKNEVFQESRFKSNQHQDSRLKIQESR